MTTTTHSLDTAIAAADDKIAVLEHQLEEARQRKAVLEEARDRLATSFPTVEEVAESLFERHDTVTTSQMTSAMRAKITRYGTMPRPEVLKLARKNLSRFDWVRNIGRGRWVRS